MQAVCCGAAGRKVGKVSGVRHPIPRQGRCGQPARDGCPVPRVPEGPEDAGSGGQPGTSGSAHW